MQEISRLSIEIAIVQNLSQFRICQAIRRLIGIAVQCGGI